MDKIKFYGSAICSGCREAKELLASKGIEVEYIDITANIPNLRAFLALRDNHPAYEAMRREGRVGLPTFVFPDGNLVIGTDWLQGQDACKDC